VSQAGRVSKSTGEAVPTTRPGLSGTTADAPGSAANNPACPGGVTSHQRRRLQAEVQHPLGVILEQVPCLLQEHRELGPGVRGGEVPDKIRCRQCAYSTNCSFDASDAVRTRRMNAAPATVEDLASA